VAAGCGKWQDANPAWAQPLFQALRDGAKEVRFVERGWGDGGPVQVGYTVDMSDHTWIRQRKDDERKRHAMRVVQLKQPRPLPQAEATQGQGAQG
jgi:hypothetical protein